MKLFQKLVFGRCQFSRVIDNNNNDICCCSLPSFIVFYNNQYLYKKSNQYHVTLYSQFHENAFTKKGVLSIVYFWWS